ncbi:MAG: YlmH/Sll1252 family protein [Ethanoligenens sp.]
MSHMGTEDNLLLSRVDDAVAAAERQTARFLGFLDAREQAVVSQYLRDSAPFFWGGYAEAERRMLGVFPQWMQPDNAAFPITAVQIAWKGAALTHRDFLGALLSLGLKREKIGDLVVRPKDCVAFLENAVAAFVLSSLSRVGSANVSCTVYAGETVHREAHFAEMTDTIASERLDCVISALTDISRTQAEKCIAGGLVTVDCLSVTDRAYRVAIGASLSVRGYGRFVVDAIGPPTRKGRLRFAARKYL